ncbi:hypothetical protein HJG60_008659 [Phyllostomus discolor]|uniref:Uncharacterized protein n=1 Tax=Phyllostomus discolor TaxID=89673 RepID=A0A834DNN2_9CHIR|nr:hypothetical protein HJG60_008659 [Phyllostomus discolor]
MCPVSRAPSARGAVSQAPPHSLPSPTRLLRMCCRCPCTKAAELRGREMGHCPRGTDNGTLEFRRRESETPSSYCSRDKSAVSKFSVKTLKRHPELEGHHFLTWQCSEGMYQMFVHRGWFPLVSGWKGKHKMGVPYEAKITGKASYPFSSGSHLEPGPGVPRLHREWQ